MTKATPQQLDRPNKRTGGPSINFVENRRTTGFLHRKEATEQNKEGGNSQPSK